LKGPDFSRAVTAAERVRLQPLGEIFVSHQAFSASWEAVPENQLGFNPGAFRSGAEKLTSGPKS
jgi:hypothetical protein